jgi:hypothetical protein
MSYVMTDFCKVLLEAWVYDTYKFEVEKHVLDSVFSDVDASVGNVGVDLASVELPARLTKTGLPSVFCFNVSDFKEVV